MNNQRRREIAVAPQLLAALKTYEEARVRRVLRADGSVTLEMDFRSLDEANAATSAAASAITKAERCQA